MKKIILIITLLISTSFAQSDGFIDVDESDWFGYDVLKLHEKSFVSGFEDGSYRPSKSVSVEEFITITINVIGEIPSDIPIIRWSDGFVKKSIELDIVKDGEFEDFTRNITRGEMSRILLRASNLNFPDNYLDYSSMISDFDEMDIYWQEIALKVFTTGLIGGYPDGSFKLNGQATRAEAAVILNKILEADRRKLPVLPISNERIEYLKDKWVELSPKFVGRKFNEVPNLKSPYSSGVLNQEFINDGVSMVKYLRLLAGLSDDVYASSSANTKSQYGAVLNATSEFSHTPKKPEDMSTTFYNTAYNATSTSNLSAGTDGLSNSVKYLMEDSDVSNIDRIGHRRWILLPNLKEFGLGYVEINSGYRKYTVMKVFGGLETVDADYDHVLWPNKDYFPTEFIKSNTPWTVTLNPNKYDNKKTSEIRVEITSKKTGVKVNFDKNDTNKSDKYFNVETNGYGVPYCIIFRPGKDTFTQYSSGDIYDVKINNIYLINGDIITFEYQIEFFDLE